MLSAGNLYQSEAETPRVDADHGYFLSGIGNGSFTAINGMKSEFYAIGDVKDMEMINIGGQQYIFTVKNDDYLSL